MLDTRKTIALLMAAALFMAACAPAAAPTPTPTKAPVAAPTQAPAPTPTKPPAPTPTPAPATLKFGSIAAISNAGIYIAIEKGFFKEQGITIEPVVFPSIVEIPGPLAAGQLDLAAMPISTGLLAAADRGIEMKIVSPAGASTPNWEYNWLGLRKDLADSGKVKTFADLKGEKLGVTSKGGIGDMYIQSMMEEAGLKPGDAELVYLGMVDLVPAFANKAIAAAMFSEPLISTAVQQGSIVKWIPMSKLFDGMAQASVVIFGPELAKNKDLGQRWMIAYLKGSRVYTDVMGKKAGRDEVVGILTKHTPVKDPKMYEVMEFPYVDPNGVLDSKSMDKQYKWYVDKGFYQGKRSFRDMMDLSFVDYAVQKLGKQ